MASQALLETEALLQDEDTAALLQIRPQPETQPETQPEACEVYSLPARTEGNFIPCEDLLSQLFSSSPDIAQKLYRADLGTTDPVALSEILQMFLMTVQLCESVKGSKRWFAMPCPLLGGQVPAQLLDSAEGRYSVRAVLHGALMGEFELMLDQAI